MKKVLREEIEKQKRLMNIREQSSIVDYIVSSLGSIFSSDEEEKVKEKKEKEKPIQAFSTVFKEIIDNIEGGYYHPNMVKDGRLSKKGGMGDSGETMFGIDRKHGGDLNKSIYGQNFWSIIDKSGAKKKWPWNYRGGQYEARLVNLATSIMSDAYQTYSRRYLTSEAKNIVDRDKGLLLHMGYAAWNGPGWFKKFANSINQEVERKVKDPKKLFKKGLEDRKNSGSATISNSAEKIKKILGNTSV